jgi:hypothetical protein
MNSCGCLVVSCQRFVREGNCARFGRLPTRKLWEIDKGWRRAAERLRGSLRAMADGAAPGFPILNFRAMTGGCHKTTGAVNPLAGLIWVVLAFARERTKIHRRVNRRFQR